LHKLGSSNTLTLAVVGLTSGMTHESIVASSLPTGQSAGAAGGWQTAARAGLRYNGPGAHRNTHMADQEEQMDGAANYLGYGHTCPCVSGC
jgi:hypothetical protein